MNKKIKMKNIFRTISFVLLIALVAVGCDPRDSRNESLGPVPTVDELDFTMTPTENPNIIEFQNISKRAGIAFWDLGNDTQGKGEKTKGIYPFAGVYTITMTLSTSGGTVQLEKELTIDADNPSLLDTEVYRNLTGGADNPDGKTWVIDQYNNFSDEVANATGYDIGGHMGLGAFDSYGQGWWKADANAKSEWTLYDHKFNFKQVGLKFNIQNEGVGYGRKASAASVGGYDVIETDGDDAIFKFEGGDYTFFVDEAGEKPIITFSGNSYMGYYCGTNSYNVLYLTDKVMALRAGNTVENQDWVFVYCLEELNIEPEEPEIPVKAAELMEDFESEELTVPFETDEMGGKTSFSYSNPAPLPVNTSSKVMLYEKPDEFYSNIFHEAGDYKFDLTDNHIIRLKVFIPSYNDFVTEHDVAGDHVSIAHLRPQVAVKLHNTEMGGNAWQSQVEIVKGDLELNKWLELEFDFSSAAERQDFDKVVIQCGGEGHKAPGIFFIDDFVMTKKGE